MEVEFLKDILLIALVGASAFYCWMLSHRLKRLNDLKSGVGASIVTLTEAIERTHSAASTARGELFEAIEEIKTLLADAEAKSDRLETAMDRADVKIVETEQAVKALNEVVDIQVPEARRKALKTTEGLLKVMADMKRLNAGLANGGPRLVSNQTASGKSDAIDPAADAARSTAARGVA